MSQLFNTINKSFRIKRSQSSRDIRSRSSNKLSSRMSTHDLSEPGGGRAAAAARAREDAAAAGNLRPPAVAQRARTPGCKEHSSSAVSGGIEGMEGKRVCKGRTRELAVIHPKFTQESGLHMSSEIETSRGKMVIQHLTNQENSSNARPSILENCAHFHYEYAEIGPIQLELREDSLATSTGSKESGSRGGRATTDNNMMYLIRAQTLPGAKGGARTWVIRRSLDDLESLDKQLHTCVYDRKYSRLPVISQIENINSLQNQEVCIDELVASYLARLGELVCPLVTCGPVLSWLEIDNKGNRYIISDDCDINTPAVAAAYAVKKYAKQAQDEISFQVGDMISVIDMPEPEESVWWRGKRGFDVGFFPCDCVEIIGDKVPTNITNLQGGNPAAHSQTLPHLHRRNSTQSDSPSEPTKPVLRKHGKLITFFRSFILSRPARGKLKKRGILKERVFGCDLGEHLLNSGQDVPKVLVHCAEFIENRGIVDGIYRLSGISSNIQRLRVAFDEDRIPNLYEDKQVLQDIHSVSSLLKMYFRELPNPVCTFHLYDQFVAAAKSADDTRLAKLREVVFQLPPPNYRTLEYLSRHLFRVASKYHDTGMTPKNVAIVWAPNLLRCKQLEVGGVAALQGVGIQAVVTEYLIKYCDFIFTDAGMPPATATALSPTSEINFVSPLASSPAVLSSAVDTSADGSTMSAAALAATSAAGGVSTSTPIKSRPKSLALTTPSQLRVCQPTQKYIDVGGGPANLPPTYHTIIQLPGGSFKHKKSSTPWKNIFFKDKKKMDRKVSSPSMIRNLHISQISTLPSPGARALRPVRSAENLAPTPPSHVTSPLEGAGVDNSGASHRNSKESDELGPLELVSSALERHGSPKSHNRSSSHDSYFERKMSVQFQLENTDLHTSNLDISEIQVNFEQEDHEMKILSEDETMISTSVGSEVSLRSPLEEIPRQNPRGNSPMRYRGGEVIRGGGSPTKTRRLSFKEKFRKFTSPTLNRKHGDSPPIISPPPPTAVADSTSVESGTTGGEQPEEKSFKELLVTALSPESLRRKSVENRPASTSAAVSSERTVRGGVGGRVTGKTSPLKKKVEARSSPQSDTAPKRTKLERDTDNKSFTAASSMMMMSKEASASHEVIVTSASVLASNLEDSLSAKDLNDPSISFSPSIRFIDASSSYELVSDSDEIIADTDKRTTAADKSPTDFGDKVMSGVESVGGDNDDNVGVVVSTDEGIHSADHKGTTNASDDRSGRSTDECLGRTTTPDSSQNDLREATASVEVVEADVHMHNLVEDEEENPPKASSLQNVPTSLEVTPSAKTTETRPPASEADDNGVAAARKDSLRSSADSEYVLASPRGTTCSEDSLATSASSRKPSTTRSDWSYSMAGATVSDNESFSLVTSSLEDRPITSASEDHPMSSPLSEDMGLVAAEFEAAAAMTEHLTDTTTTDLTTTDVTTTDSITEKCDSLTLREREPERGASSSLYLQHDVVSSQESLQQDLQGTSQLLDDDGDDAVYTAKLVPSTANFESASLPPALAGGHSTAASGVSFSRGATRGQEAAGGDRSHEGFGGSTAPPPPPHSLQLLQSPVYEGVTLRRSPVTSPSRNRSVRSDFILNLVQQSQTDQQQLIVNNSCLEEISEQQQLQQQLEEQKKPAAAPHHHNSSTTTAKPAEVSTTSTSTTSSQSASSPTHKLSGNTIKAMMPQPFNQSKQFKRFSVEESVPSAAESRQNDDAQSSAAAGVVADDPTVESFSGGSGVQALNLDTSEEDIQLETKDLVDNQSSEGTTSSSCIQSDVRMETDQPELRKPDGGSQSEDAMHVDDDVGSYYVSVSHLSLNTSSDDKGVQMTGCTADAQTPPVQSPGTVGTSRRDVSSSTAKPPKTPKTGSRFDRERSTSTQDPSSASPMEEAPEFQWRQQNSRRSSTRSRDSLNKSRDSFDRSRDSFDRSRDSFDRSHESFDRSRDSLAADDMRCKRSSSREEAAGSGKRPASRNNSCQQLDPAANGLQNGFRSSNGSLDHEGGLNSGSCLEDSGPGYNLAVMEPQDGRRSAHELSQSEKRKSNKDRFQGGGKRVSRSVGAKSSTLSLHTTKTGCALEGDESCDGEEGGSNTPLLQRRNSIHIIPYVDVNDPETRCRMERYKEERRSILRSKYKAEDYLTSEKRTEAGNTMTSERKKKLSTSSSHDSQDEVLTYKKVSVIDDTNSSDLQPAASSGAGPAVQRPHNLDLEAAAAVKPSPRLSLKVYECKAGSSEFVEKTGAAEHQQPRKDDTRPQNSGRPVAATGGILKSDSSRNGGQQQQQPSSPVTLRQKKQQQPLQQPAVTEMRKLVDLKQPEPNGLWRRGGEERASDRKTWGSLRVSPRRTTSATTTAADGSEEASPVSRPTSIQATSTAGGTVPVTSASTSHHANLAARNSSPAIGSSSYKTGSGSAADSKQPNYGTIDESVNVRERASIFGSRTTSSSSAGVGDHHHQQTTAPVPKLRTVSVVSAPTPPAIKERTPPTVGDSAKHRALSVSSESGKRPSVLTGGSGAVTSPNKIKNMAALFEQNVK